jgi:hypothetical protein
MAGSARSPVGVIDAHRQKNIQGFTALSARQDACVVRKRQYGFAVKSVNARAVVFIGGRSKRRKGGATHVLSVGEKADGSSSAETCGASIP